MTPTPQLNLFDALSEAPDPKARATARADTSAPAVAEWLADPDPAKLNSAPAFDPFAYPDYGHYCTAWCYADLDHQNGRGPNPGPCINDPHEWGAARAATQKEETTCQTQPHQ